jgi:hypothetical protein
LLLLLFCYWSFCPIAGKCDERPPPHLYHASLDSSHLQWSKQDHQMNRLIPKCIVSSVLHEIPFNFKARKRLSFACVHSTFTCVGSLKLSVTITVHQQKLPIFYIMTVQQIASTFEKGKVESPKISHINK